MSKGDFFEKVSDKIINADADKDFKSIELSTIKYIHQYWVDRNDGWDKDLNVHLKSIGITILAE